jgi:hypothetical protein
MAPRAKQRGGILIRGATGELYAMRHGDPRPRKIGKNSKLAKAFEAHVRKNPPTVFARSDLPEDVLELLEDLFGPLSGLWWWFASQGLRR